MAVRAVDKLTAVYGTQYTIGTSTNVLCKLFKQKKTKKIGTDHKLIYTTLILSFLMKLDIASGGSDDWAKGGAGIPYSYTVELRDTGKFGFELPAT